MKYLYNKKRFANNPYIHRHDGASQQPCRLLQEKSKTVTLKLCQTGEKIENNVLLFFGKFKPKKKKNSTIKGPVQIIETTHADKKVEEDNIFLNMK